MDITVMATAEVQQAEQVWPYLSKLVFVPHTEQQYQQLVTLLNALIDDVGEAEQHPLASLMELVGVLIEMSEDQHVPELTEV